MPHELTSPSEQRDDQGFTLVEVLVVVLLLGVIGAVFSSSVLGALKTERRTSERADVQHSVTLAMDRLGKQVRVAAPLLALSSTGATVDVYSVGGAAEQRRRHVYALDLAAGRLTETVSLYSPATATTPTSTSSRVLARGLSGGSFTGFKRDGSTTTVAAQVATVAVSLTGQAAEGPPHTAKTTIFLRNFKG